MDLSTTLAPPPGPEAPTDDDSEGGLPTTAFYAAIIGVLLIIVVIALFVGKYRLSDNRDRWRGPNSHSLIYSVTMHGAGGSSFLNSIEDFLRESRRISAIENGDTEDPEQREVTLKPITGLPSYEESISSYPVRPPDSTKDELPPPPPYTES